MKEDKTDEFVELPSVDVQNRLADVLCDALGLDYDSALATLQHLIRTEQAGKSSHGLIRVHYTARSGKFGPYDGIKPPAFEKRGSGWLHVVGSGYLGYPIMDRLITAGCDSATRHGHTLVTGVAVYPSGCLGDWARCAAESGIATLIMGGSPPRVAAPGRCQPVVGTNPFCVGIPAHPLPFICDASTSEITHGELILARSGGKAISSGSAVDSEGCQSTDPNKIDPTRGLGALLPVGGSHKTFAIAMAIELLTSLGGGIPGSPNLAEHGIFALFIGPDVLGDTPQRVGAWLASLDATGQRVPGWLPGRRLAEQRARGVVHVPKTTLKVLKPWLEAVPI